MKRIDTPTALTGGHFTNANPDAGGAPTQLDASWFENVQEELANVVEESGQALNGGDKKQVLKAIQSLINRAGIAIPPGTSIKFRGESVPEGYLQEDGRLLYIDKCPGLYAAIGNRYNGGVVPVGTFRIPDSRGRTDVAAGTGTGLSPRAVGDQGGAESVALSEVHLPAHSHDVILPETSAIGDADGGDARVMTSNNEVVAGADPATYITTADTGTGEAHNNMPPYLVALSCIKLGTFDDPVAVV